MSTPTQPQTGADVMAQFIPSSPFVAKLGIVADVLDADEVRLRLPWDPTNVTVADMVHGGAIAALADVAVMAAAWAGAEVPDSLRGVTTSMSMQFLAPARATDLIAIGRVLRRGKTLVNVRRRRRHAGRRGGREGDRDLQSGLTPRRFLHQGCCSCRITTLVQNSTCA